MKPQKVDINNDREPHFIGCWSAIDKPLCTRIINFFETHPELQKDGAVGSGQINQETKHSKDIIIHPVDLQNEGYEPFNEYFDALHACFKAYCDEWEFLKTFIEKIHLGAFNMQKYDVGGHFNEVHSEKTGFAKLPRILVWMTYLNDVEEGGETEFTHYDLKVKPEAGKTLIWPAEWTHAHRGNPTKSGEKYILTGWLHMVSDFNSS